MYTYMKTIKHLINCSLGLFAVAALASCQLIYDGEGDCSAEYSVKFVDDLNMKSADAFDTEVKSLSLYAFDESGTLAWYGSKTINEMKEDGKGHTIDVSNLAPGKYHLVAWGGLYESRGSFSTPRMSRAGQVHMEDVACRLSRKEGADGMDYIDTDLDDLFHGSADIEIPEDTDEGDKTFEVHLTKNTNHINVVLQQLNGENLDPDDYEFVIEADNGQLDHNNNLVKEDRRFIYRAYDKISGEAGYADSDATINSVSAILARFTISRLQLNDWSEFTRPMLTVYNVTTDEKLLSIPLIDYALLVRNNYDYVTSDQDYLDRQDEYNITFFVQSGRWLDSEIIINSWRVILNNKDL